MKKTINLNSKEWCDVIFRNKNKSYGAYQMRMTSSKRHIMAFGITVLIAIAIIVLPALISKISATTKTKTDGLDTERVMSIIEFETPKEVEVIEVAIPKPPQELYAKSIKFTAPVVGENEDVDENAETHTMDELLDATEAIGFVDNAIGTDDLAAELLKEERLIVEILDKGPVDFAEIMPQFPGGPEEMMAFISKNLKYPVVDIETGTQGRVTVRFVVTKTGAIDNVEVLRGVSSGCDREAIRVVKSMPTWIPGKQNGTPVAVYFTLPILYRLK